MGYSRHGSSGAGLSDSASRDRRSRNRKDRAGKSVSRPGQPDQPGEAEAKMRKAGVSESDISRSQGRSTGSTKTSRERKLAGRERELAGRERKVSGMGDLKSKYEPGQPDRPGEAREKMIAAGVMTPEGRHKEIGVIGGSDRPRPSEGFQFGEIGKTYEQMPSGRYVEAGKTPTRQYAQPFDYVKAKMAYDEALIKQSQKGWAGKPGMPDQPGEAVYKTQQAGVFDVDKETTNKKIVDSRPWYQKAAQVGGFQAGVYVEDPKTLTYIYQDKVLKKFGYGGAIETKELSVLEKEHDLLLKGGKQIQAEQKRREIDSKYAEYNKAVGTSPIPAEHSEFPQWERGFGSLAKTIRSARVPKTVLAEGIQEWGAGSLEMIGAVPRVIKYAPGAIAKDPWIVPAFVSMAAIETTRFASQDPAKASVMFGMDIAACKLIPKMPHVPVKKISTGISKTGFQGVEGLSKTIVKHSPENFGRALSSIAEGIPYHEISKAKVPTPKGLTAQKQKKFGAGMKLVKQYEHAAPIIKEPLDFSKIKALGESGHSVEKWIRIHPEMDPVVGGSASAYAQFPHSRLPGDLDLMVRDVSLSSKQLYDIIRKEKGEQYTRLVQKPEWGSAVIETRSGLFEPWHHAVDFQPSIKLGSQIRSATATEKRLSIDTFEFTTQPAIKISGIHYVPASELMLRKADSALRPFKGDIGASDIHRPRRKKDIIDFEKQISQFISRSRDEAKTALLFKKAKSKEGQKRLQTLETYKFHSSYGLEPFVKEYQKLPYGIKRTSEIMALIYPTVTRKLKTGYPKPYPKIKRAKPYPRPAPVKLYPRPTAVEPYPKPATVKPYPKAATVKPYPKPAIVKPYPRAATVKAYPKPAIIKPSKAFITPETPKKTKPLIKPKSSKQKSKKRKRSKSTAKKHQIVNPIATVEQVMTRITGIRPRRQKK